MTINWQNWQDESLEFKNFAEKSTQIWIQEGFNKDQARDWIKIGFSSLRAYFYKNIKNLTPLQFEKLNGEQKNELERNINNMFFFVYNK